MRDELQVRQPPESLWPDYRAMWQAEREERDQQIAERAQAIKLARIGRPEVIAKAVALLQEVLDHINSLRPQHTWESEFFPISQGTYNVRPGRPDAESPEVELLIHFGLVQFIDSSTNPYIPDASLRMLERHREKAETIITRYLNTLENSNNPKILTQ